MSALTQLLRRKKTLAIYLHFRAYQAIVAIPPIVLPDLEALAYHQIASFLPFSAGHSQVFEGLVFW